MKKIVSIAVTGLFLGVGALRVSAAAAAPTTWVQTVNVSMTAESSDVNPAGKFTIASKDIINLLSDAVAVTTNTVSEAVTNLVDVLGTNLATAAAIEFNPTNTVLLALSTNTAAGFPTNNITLTNFLISLTATNTAATNAFITYSNTLNLTFTELSSNVYFFTNAYMLTNISSSTVTNLGIVTTNSVTNTTIAYLVTNDFTFMVAATNSSSGTNSTGTSTNSTGSTNTTLSFSQPAITLYATNQPGTNWVLVAGSLSTEVTNVVQMPTNILTITTNTISVQAFNPTGAKLVYVTPLDGSTNNWEIITPGRNGAVIDVTPFITLIDAAPDFDVISPNGKTMSSIQQLTIIGHDSTLIVLQGLFIATKGPNVRGQGVIPGLTKSISAPQVAGYASIEGLQQRNNAISANVVMGGRITTTGAAK